MRYNPPVRVLPMIVVLIAACGGTEAPAPSFEHGPPGMGTEWCPFELFDEPQDFGADRDPTMFGLWHSEPNDQPVSVAVHDQVHEVYILEEDGSYVYSRPGWYFGFGRWAVRNDVLLLLEEEIVIGNGGGTEGEQLMGIVCLMDRQEPPLVHQIPLERCDGDACLRFRETPLIRTDGLPYVPHAFFARECNRGG